MYTLSEQLKKQHLGDHICLVYDGPEQQMAAIIPYLKQGLERNEACVYIVDDRTLPEVREALAKSGLDVAKLEATGALGFATKRESYLRFGSFDPLAMLKFLRELVEQAVAKGFSGYRITGEMTWALGDECGCERLIEYEALLNGFFPGSKAMAICQYNRRRFPAEIIRDVLRTHPYAILNDQVCPNLYYETPEMILGKASAEKRVDWMIGNLSRFRSSEIVLQEEVQERDEFLSIASHELKTPLTSLQFEIQGLSREIARNETSLIPRDRVCRTVEKTGRQVKRLAQLVDSLLDVSRINSGRFVVEPERVEVGELVSSVVTRLQDQLERSKCAVSVKIGKNVIAEWDRPRMEQVVTNLLTNAMKYGQGKPVEVAVETSDGRATLSVTDHGMGILADDVDRIFERFERAVPASAVSGFGLGLFIVKKILDAHTGSVRVRSLPGKGSTFIVELPLRPFPEGKVRQAS